MTKKLLLAYKGNKCAVCGLSVQDMLDRYGTFKRMTEFHHIDPKKKAKNYTSLIRRKICSEQLAELDKCALLCSNCHGVVHEQNNKCRFTFTLNFNGKSYVQTLNGQIVFDFLDKKAKFLTDERFKLGIYVVKIGDSTPRHMVGVEMDSIEFFSDILKNIDETGPVTIWDEFMNTPLFHLKSIGNGEFNLQHSFKFPLLSYESADNLTKFWIKNGVYIDEDGGIHESGKVEITGKFMPLA